MKRLEKLWRATRLGRRTGWGGADGVVDRPRAGERSGLWLAAGLLGLGAFAMAAAGRAALRHTIVVPGPATIGVIAPKPKSGDTAIFSRIQVDDSFGARDMLRTANHLVKSGHAAKAVRKYQKIVEQFGRKVIATGPDSYESVEAYIWQLVIRLPAVRTGLYDQLYGLQAKEAVAKAEQNSDIRGLISICRRYFPSTAAAKGLSLAAERLFERGSFADATRIWLGLLDHPAMVKRRPELLDHAALAAWLAGRKSLALRLQARLKKRYPKAMGLINGSWGLPTTFVLDREGRVVYRAVGGREFDNPELVAQLRGLLQNRR